MACVIGNITFVFTMSLLFFKRKDIVDISQDGQKCNRCQV